MTKKLIAIRVSMATKAKLDSLAQIHGTQTEVVALAIDRLHQEEIKMKSHTDHNGTPLNDHDAVLIDGTHHATVVIAGANRSLLSHRRSDGEAGEEREWYANDRLTLFTKAMQAALQHKREIEALKRSDDEAQAHSNAQRSASYG